VKYAFITRHQAQFPVSALCRALGVSRSGYHDWRTRQPSSRTQANQRLLTEIQRIHRESRQAYGSLKTWYALNQQGIVCGKHRVARLRRSAGIEARRKRRFRVTVEHHRTPAAAPDRLRRNFMQTRMDQAWVGDVTFIRTRCGWLYLSMLLDLYSRKVVGWSMSARNDEALALGALEMAIAHRQPEPGLIHHTDRGALYQSRNYRDRMGRVGMLPSMGNVGTAYDNAVAESFFSNLKNELIHHCDFETREEARAAIFSYIELFYNRQRIHQTLGFVSPQQFEDQGRVP
jgi:transposase InsO family protein